MQRPQFHPPRAPPDHLRLQSFQILSRLERIEQFRPWLELTRYHVHRKRHTPLELLWDCFAFGAPLGTLLNLLGSPSPSHMVEHVEEFDFGLSTETREMYFASFIQRVQMLEVQGRLPYGEVLRCEDFLADSGNSFAKVLRTVYRLLFTLQEVYPGIFTSAPDARVRKRELLDELSCTEESHLTKLQSVEVAVSNLTKSTKCIVPSLEVYLAYYTPLVTYHESLARCFEDVTQTPDAPVNWTRTLRLDDDRTRTQIFGAYRSLCINYLNLVEFLERLDSEDSLQSDVATVLHDFSSITARISVYQMILQDLLNITLPTEDQLYNALCEAVFRLSDITETMDEVGCQLRTIRWVETLRNRAYIWSAPEPDRLGSILLDDMVVVNPVKGLQYSVFLFEDLLLCCQEGRGFVDDQRYEHAYPIYSWEVGPALKRRTPLDIVHVIPTSRLISIYSKNTSTIEVAWLDPGKRMRKVTFFLLLYAQWEQWISVLQPFVPPIRLPVDDPTEQVSEDESTPGLKILHKGSWSLKARKGPHSETSSFVFRPERNNDFQFSPELLPTLFSTAQDEILRSPSPISSRDVILSRDRPPTPPMDDGIHSEENCAALLDLTGQIKRQGNYPAAHGGFSDVWKGTWRHGGREHKVAIKVLRSKMGDTEAEDRMVKRLRRELSIWKNLEHPNILKLHGVVSDFGHYTSMVCPWFEKGNVTKYLERCGDILSTAERLKLLCEIADGLYYLHSRSIVHGDLSGSNVLLTDEGTACLCDFGLSNVMAEFQGSAFLTTTIGGAVRWTDALLYQITDEEGNPPQVTTWNDIYSFGSIMLEVLSGRIPYHYLRMDAQVVIELHRGNKPRRPAQNFVSDAQWDLMQRCWSDVAEKRPTIEQVQGTLQMFYEECL